MKRDQLNTLLQEGVPQYNTEVTAFLKKQKKFRGTHAPRSAVNFTPAFLE